MTLLQKFVETLKRRRRLPLEAWEAFYEFRGDELLEAEKVISETFRERFRITEMSGARILLVNIYNPEGLEKCYEPFKRQVEDAELANRAPFLSFEELKDFFQRGYINNPKKSEHDLFFELPEAKRSYFWEVMERFFDRMETERGIIE